jgi:hypothetical protein
MANIFVRFIGKGLHGPQRRLDAWTGRHAPDRVGACRHVCYASQTASAPARRARQVNKMDDPSITGPDGAWSQERYNEICTGLTPFLKACGYNPKKDIVFLPMSGLLGHNLRDAVPPGVCPWWKARQRALPFRRAAPRARAGRSCRMCRTASACQEASEPACLSYLSRSRQRRRARAAACRCRRLPCRLRD